MATISSSNSSSPTNEAADVTKIKIWQSEAYGGVKNIKLVSIEKPIISGPNEVLIKVEAASLNPIDPLMIEGYGRTLINIMRKGARDLPLTVGRDFSGVIIAKGTEVKDYDIGDEVYGFIPIPKQGAFAQVIVAETPYIFPKPKHLTHTESASLVYASMTAWCALFIDGSLESKEKNGVRILILGASGGLGTACIQLLKSQKCIVHCTCSTDAVEMLTSLGADKVFDYKDKDFKKNIEKEEKYFILLDGAQTGYENIPRGWKFEKFITLNSPLFKNTDKSGLILGLIQSMGTLLRANLSWSTSVRWGFFRPSHEGFSFIHNLIINEKIKPVIHKNFKFEELPEAFQTMANGHLRGKIVLDYSQ